MLSVVWLRAAAIDAKYSAIAIKSLTHIAPSTLANAGESSTIFGGAKVS